VTRATSPASTPSSLPDASHWVHHDEPQRVTELLTAFFAPAQARGGSEV
jgi:pimeloyl-ACP methyl ester carboxylesterase